MNEPIDVTLPIDAYFKRIEDCIQLAGDANTPFSNQQVLQTTYFAVQATGLYKDGLKEWRLQHDNEKMLSSAQRGATPDQQCSRL